MIALPSDVRSAHERTMRKREEKGREGFVLISEAHPSHPQPQGGQLQNAGGGSCGLRGSQPQHSSISAP